MKLAADMYKEPYGNVDEEKVVAEIERLRNLLRERGWQEGTPQWCDWEGRVRDAVDDNHVLVGR